MYGATAVDLIRELKRTNGIPPYNVRASICVRSILFFLLVSNPLVIKLRYS